MPKHWLYALSLLAITVSVDGGEKYPNTIYESRVIDGVVVCNEKEALPSIFSSSSTTSNAFINPHVNATGLTILLRPSTQMDAFPAAKAAFVRAADTWESYLTSPITIIVDVDFGPKRFGQPYLDAAILGSTDPSSTVITYPLALLGLRSSATRQYEADLYAQLPVGTLSTDLGVTGLIVAPRSELRALGWLAAIPGATDPAPSIGFNSGFSFDFDRSDGIGSGRVDFESVAFHELGHALGFASTVGQTESNPGLPIAASILDLFRVRPGGSLLGFSSAQRIQSSGGNQVFFSGLGEADLATGRPDGSGGDGSQASHWKSETLTGFYLGAMHPGLFPQTIAYATVNDLVAFDVLGYNVNYPAPPGDPTSLTATATGSTDIQLTWVNHATNASEFRLEEYSNGRWIEIGGIPSTRSAATVSGLNPDTTYYFALQASNAGGYSKFTNQASAKTLSSCVQPAVTNQPASQTISSGASAALSFAATGTGPQTYQWYQGSRGTGPAVSGATLSTYTTPQLFVTTSYWVRVSNGCGSADSLAALVTVTPPASPSAPTDLSFANRTSDGVLLAWRHDGKNLSVFRGYFSIPGSAAVAMNDMPPDWRSTQISNMRSDVEYRFYVVAVNSSGESLRSNIVVVPAFKVSRRRAAHH